ncbi:MAG: neutral/alkaline non-lysosomal ceramidase N-terminal domain-containing protein [Planctomycetota bacterium]
MKPMTTRYRSLRRFRFPLTAIALALSTLSSGCRLFVDRTQKITPEPAVPGVASLSRLDMFSFGHDNLGEISPGLAYRSAKPSRKMLDFLKERCQLGHILSLRGTALTPGQEAFIAEGHATLSTLRMSARRPPNPRDVLELIRVTHEARRKGHSFLLHCRAGADRTGVMVAVWRMLFEGETDREKLKNEAYLFGHIDPRIDQLYETVDTFRPEIYAPFVENPDLVPSDEQIEALEAQYYSGFSVLSGDRNVVTGPLRAGVAKVPLVGDTETGLQMATYGPNPGVSKGVREPVYARSLVLEVPGKRVAFVSADLMIMDRELRSMVLRLLDDRDIEIDDLLLSATHTHTSLGGYVDYGPAEFYIMGRFSSGERLRIARAIAESVVRASRARVPVRVGYGTASCSQSGNRRLGTTVDPEVGILKLIRDEDEAPFAVVVNYAAHPILEPDDLQISPDYPGLLAKKLDAKYGFGMFLQGALGDVNARAKPKRDDWRTKGHAEVVADALFAAVESRLEDIEVKREVELASFTATFPLPPVNIGLIPELFAPIEWIVKRFLGWKKRLTVQAVRVGDLLIGGTSSEIAVALGLEIKSRSPSGAKTMTVALANDYSGYAVRQVDYAKRKLDATSIPCLHGPRHGRVVVDRTAALLRSLWPAGEDANPDGAPVARPAPPQDPADDPTVPQNIRTSRSFRDSLGDRIRFEVDSLYLDNVRGTQGVAGTRRELRLATRLRGPWDARIELETGWLRSSFIGAPNSRGDEGFSDLRASLSRPWKVTVNHENGDALRWAPVFSLQAPTGNPDPNVPFALAASTGTWRPAVGAELEITGNTYRSLHFAAHYVTALGRHAGRQPGDRIETAIGYQERHGFASLGLDLHADVQRSDSRLGGRTAVDVGRTSYNLNLRPSLLFHVGSNWRPFIEGRLPIARSGDGAGGGLGLRLGLSAAF